MQRSYSDTNFATSALRDPEEVTADNMGNVNSPQIRPAFSNDQLEASPSFQTQPEMHALADAVMENLSYSLGGAGGRSPHEGAHDHEITKNEIGNTGHKERAMTELKEPSTPTKRRLPVHWHGLPSPQTPNFAKYTSEPLSGSSSDGTNDGDDLGVSRTKRAGGDNPQDLFARANEYLGQDAKYAMPANVHAAVEELQQMSRRSRGPFSPTHSAVPKEEDCVGVEATGCELDSNAILARQLDDSQSPTQTRRSTRLRRQPKPTYTLEPLKATPKTARRPVVGEEAPAQPVQPEFSIVPCKSDPIPFDGMPTVNSLSFQLQYPPGGSTHLSYPYPNLDPRLIFHHPFVPLVNGLPEVSHVPKLVLPIGWKHVTWFGLLPIVFDPYQQAFKLTPVGPLPLTYEELHQGGLHKYVPGGELHPEYGMLPDMRQFSDGSDADVYNFDGVDWTLPWEGQVNFHAPSSNSQAGCYSLMSSNSSGEFVVPVAYPWNEARDCPNLIIDLSDAWRWFAAKETNPTADFVPTPKKKWHGTGAHRSTRKIKSPIPELMMLALQAEQSSSPSPVSVPNPILQNQDTPTKGKRCNDFCPFKSVATPMNVDITLLGDTEFTIMELLGYFPQHYYWGHAADRLARGGVQPRMIRDIICMTRALEGDMVSKSASISTTAGAARRRDVIKSEDIEEVDIDEVGKDTPPPAPTPTTKPAVVDITASYTAEGWTYDVWEKIDYPLLALAHGLQSLPTGADAGPLTALIHWCREKGRYQVLLSDVPGALKEAGIEPLIEPGESGCPDREVVERHAEVLKKERSRALRSAKAIKRAMEEKEEGKSKRRKME